MSMLDRLLAYSNELRRRGSSREAQRDTLVSILFHTLSGLQS
jgi:hypothetical protein